jgi:peptidoglycan hydrolase-like protein with peptidoglycan-binding domain
MTEKVLAPFVLLGFLAMIGGIVGHSGSSVPTPSAPAVSATPSSTHATIIEPLPLSVDEIKEVQTRLNVLGFDAGLADGTVGPQTQAAIARFAAAREGVAASPLGRQILERLRSEKP